MDKFLLAIPVLMLMFLFLVPLKAFSDCQEIDTTPIQRCGLHCVIETKVCDSELDAQQFALNYIKSGGIVNQVYNFKQNPSQWFVDYQITEAEGK